MTNAEQKKELKFKKYTDPEYKKKHNAYNLHKIECDCGVWCARTAIYKHKKSKSHLAICPAPTDRQRLEKIMDKLIEDVKQGNLYSAFFQFMME